MRLAAVLCFTGWLMLWTPPRSSARQLTGDPLPDPYVLTNNTIMSTLRHIVTPDNQVIFTTISFPKTENGTGPNMKMLNNFAFWLDKADALKHTMIITTDERHVGMHGARGWGGMLT